MIIQFDPNTIGLSTCELLAQEIRGNYKVIKDWPERAEQATAMWIILEPLDAWIKARRHEQELADMEAWRQQRAEQRKQDEKEYLNFLARLANGEATQEEKEKIIMFFVFKQRNRHPEIMVAWETILHATDPDDQAKRQEIIDWGAKEIATVIQEIMYQPDPPELPAIAPNAIPKANPPNERNHSGSL